MVIDSHSKEGAVLVDKYDKLYQRKIQLLEEIESEMESLKEVIVKYAKENGFEVIFGTDKKITVKQAKKFKFPGKRTKKREELESFLRNINRWDQISTLDTFALDKIIQKGYWPEETLTKIKDFGKFEESVRFSLTDRRDKEE